MAKLQEFIQFKNGKKRPTDKGNIPVYGGNGILDYANESNLKECVIIGRVGAYCGSVYLSKGECWVSDNAISAQPRDNAHLDFVYYLLKYLRLNEKQIGTGQPLLTQEILNRIEYAFPSLEVQEKMATILSSIDKKISQNKQINDNLYQLLALSFKHDYLEADTNGWLPVSLGDVTSKFATGLNPRKNFVLGHGNNFYVTIKNMGNNRIYLDDKCDKVDDEALVKINKRSNLQVGDLLFSGIGTIGRVYLLHKPADNWNISESVFTLRPDSRVSSDFLYLLLLSDAMQDYAISNSQGSVQKGIRMADLKRYSILLPPKSIMDELTTLWHPMIEKIKENEDEADRLTTLRDTILPKLMSGEIDVSEVEV